MRRASLLYASIGLLACIAVFAVYAGAGKNTQQGIGPASLSGNLAQSFEVPSLSGERQSLQTYRGHILVMNLWASWCPPCRAEMPDLQRLSSAYSHNNVVVVGVNQGESAERARAFANALGIHFAIWLDQDQEYGRVYAALGMPTTIIIDPHGRVARGFDGALTFDQMVAAVRPLIGKP